MDDLMTSFAFSVKDWGQDGWARVEYRHATFGAVVKQVFIPMNRSAEEQRGAIIMQFPSTTFHSRWIELLARENPQAPAVLEGDFVYSVARPEDNPVEQMLPTAKV